MSLKFLYKFQKLAIRRSRSLFRNQEQEQPTFTFTRHICSLLFKKGDNSRLRLRNCSYCEFGQNNINLNLYIRSRSKSELSLSRNICGLTRSSYNYYNNNTFNFNLFTPTPSSTFSFRLLGFKGAGCAKSNICLCYCASESVFYYSYRNMSKSKSKVYVKNIPDEERIQIHFDLSNEDGHIKTFSLNRLKKEEHGVALERLKLNLSKKMNKKKKKKTSKDSPSTSEESESDGISFDIWHNGQSFPTSVENEKAWIEGAQLRYGNEDISILINVPSVKLEKFPSMIITDSPLFPRALFDFCDSESCEFYWNVIQRDSIDSVKTKIAQGLPIKLDDSFHENIFFTPCHSDIGQYVILVCVPKCNEITGKPDAIVSDVCITKGPSEVCPFEKRHEFTKNQSNNEG